MTDGTGIGGTPDGPGRVPAATPVVVAPVSARRWPRPPEIVVLGSASRDVTDEDPRGWRLGGGVTYSALAAARLGMRTAAVVGVDSEASVASELDDLRAAGAELLLAPLPEGPVFRNVEAPGGRIQTAIRAGVPLPVAPLPDSWRRSAAWLLAPVAAEIDDGWVDAIPDDAFVAVAWQGFLRTLVSGKRVARRSPAPSRLLARADIVAVSHHDLDPGTPLATLYPLLRPGARLLVTQGADGGFLVTLGSDRQPVEEVRYRPSGPTPRSIRPVPGTPSSPLSCRRRSGARSPGDHGAGSTCPSPPPQARSRWRDRACRPSPIAAPSSSG